MLKSAPATKAEAGGTKTAIIDKEIGSDEEKEIDETAMNYDFAMKDKQGENL